MIRLDIDLNYLAQNYQIGTSRINQYTYKTIDQIMETEAAQGNAQAADFELDVLKDPRELLKLFKLASAENRYRILRNMSTADLIYLLQFLEPQDLLMGLLFFTKEKLLQLIYKLPKEKMAKILFNKFSPEKFLKMIPEKEINKFFDSDKLDKEKIMDYIKTIDPDKLNKMMAKFIKKMTGKKVDNFEMEPEQIFQFLDKLKPDQFKEALKCFEKEEKMGIILHLTKDDPKLFTEFSKDALIFPLTQLEKPDIVKAMNKLEPEDLIKMVQELPDDFLAAVVTQIDPLEFAEVLIKNYQDILSEIAIGNN